MTSFLKNVRESLTPTLKQSAFLQRGVLTPEEFVKAGDELVHQCPTWSWEGASDESKSRSHLPKNKQYLVTRNVPCKERCSEMEKGASSLGMMKEDGDGWMLEDDGKGGDDDDFDFVDEGDSEKPPSQAEPTTSPVAVVDDDDEYADIDEFEDDTLVTDTAALTVADNILAVRTYDVMISYDKYYQTPRVWLSGYSESRSPLSGDEMFEDCMSDYVKRTVTIESFPYTAAVVISIHPCQHGNVMKNIVGNLTQGEGGGEIVVEQYMFVFLKFVASMIPTINYDFTNAVETGGGSGK
ncbi:hypothetical protein TL16_g04746, partial [Triparma laevis f. inornata]|uniref:Autophagy-related protein 3 n=2 Tax=Triparma laevis TaxID=1534972 RepID=A0A9W7B4T1_9STRA